MIKLDKKEVKIVKELIKNPRISDSKLAKNTGISVMTVNRKRKKLEKNGLLKYYVTLDTSELGIGTSIAKNLYTIKFKIGITKDQFLESTEKDKTLREFNASYISSSYLGEKDGHLALILILEAKSEADLLDKFNSNLIPFLRKKLGTDSIVEVTSSKIIQPIRIHHNYLPYMNMKDGKIKKDWSDDWIFVHEAIEITNKFKN